MIEIDEDREFTPGLTFVALSRAKSLDGILLQPFSKARFFQINKSSVLQLKDKAEQILLKKQL